MIDKNMETIKISGVFTSRHKMINISFFYGKVLAMVCIGGLHMTVGIPTNQTKLCTHLHQLTYVYFIVTNVNIPDDHQFSMYFSPPI